MSTPAGMRVLVTGAAGCIGSHVVEQLVRQHRHTVIATDLRSSSRVDELSSSPAVVFRAADLRDRASLRDLVESCDAVVHLAAVLRTACDADPRLGHDVNVGATVDLLTLCREFGVRRLIYGSSVAVYGSDEGFDARSVTLKGLNVYGAGKLAAEAYLDAFSRSGGPGYIALRFGTVYGPGVNPGSNGSVMVEVLRALDRGERPVVSWSRAATHALTYVTDAAEATVRALDADVSGVAIDVAGPPLSSEELYTTLVRSYGADPARIDWRENTTRSQGFDQRRAADELDGFRCNIGLEDGVRAFIDWYRTHAEQAD